MQNKMGMWQWFDRRITIFVNGCLTVVRMVVGRFRRSGSLRTFLDLGSLGIGTWAVPPSYTAQETKVLIIRWLADYESWAPRQDFSKSKNNEKHEKPKTSEVGCTGTLETPLSLTHPCSAACFFLLPLDSIIWVRVILDLTFCFSSFLF
jgi:hypothetical protein